MDETGDKNENKDLSFTLNGLDLNAKMTDISVNSVNENRVLIDIIEEMKDKCELIVNTSDSSPTVGMSPEDDPYLRKKASEADIDENDYQIGVEVDYRPNEKIDKRLDDRNRDPLVGDNCSDKEVIKVSIVSTETKDTTNCHQNPSRVEDMSSVATGELVVSSSQSFRHKDVKTRTEKWGESVGIVDENGSVRRVVALNELNNYLILKSSQLQTDSNIYCSLINERFPRFFDSTIDYFQRWRMRYNIFADKVMADRTDPSLLHIGEIHLYFDLIPKFPNPYYVNNSFYSNTLVAERAVDEERVQRVKNALDSYRKSRSIFQLKFPIDESVFQKTNDIFDKFMERQLELIDESHSVHRKHEQRRRFYGSSRGRPPQPMRRQMTRYNRDFGQSSRDFHQTGRRFARNDRNSEPMYGSNRSMIAPNHRNDTEFNENQRGLGLGRNERGAQRMSGRGFGDSKRGNDRKAHPFKGRQIDNESDVTFEDTRERHERNANNSALNRTSRGFGRFDDNRESDQQLEAMRAKSGANYEPNARNSGRSLDYEKRRPNSDSLKAKDKQYFSSFFSRRGQSNGPPMESTRRSHFGYNPNQTNRAFSYSQYESKI